MIALEPGAAGAFMQRLGPGDRRDVRPAARDRLGVGAHRGARAGAAGGAAPRSRLRLRRLRSQAAARCATTPPARPTSRRACEALLAEAGIAAQTRRPRAASTTARGRRCATSIRLPTSRCCRSPSCRARARRSSSRSARRSRRSPPRACSCSAAAASRTTCAACSPTACAPPTDQPEIAGKPGVPRLDRASAAGARLGRTVRLSQPGAARGRHASDRRAPAAVVRRGRRRRPRRPRRCACTTA